MNGAVDFVFYQRHLELAREETLGANLGERFIQLFVAGGLEGDELRRDAARKQRVLDQSRLSQRELRGTRADSYNVRFGLFPRRHPDPPTRAHRASIPSLPL